MAVSGCKPRDQPAEWGAAQLNPVAKPAKKNTGGLRHWWTHNQQKEITKIFVLDTYVVQLNSTVTVHMVAYVRYNTARAQTTNIFG